MTLVVASATGETPDELYDAGRKAAAVADVVEVRLDGPSGLPWDLRAFFSFDKPCIATVRHVLDGGRTEMDDAARADLLRRALRAGARYVDVEVWSDEARSLVKEAHQHRALAIVSRHFPEGTPPEESLLHTLRECRAVGADHAKVATHARTPADAATLVRTALRARDEGISYALMAVNDPFLRLLAPTLGMALAYGSVPDRPAAAPGQVPAPDLRAAHARLALARPVTGATRIAFLLGHPVAHSRSPAMHNAAFPAAGLDARYVALDVAPAALGAAIAGLKGTNALGCNLTIPHKEAALAHMDALFESARASGAVNTVVFREGKAHGHNTDGEGALDALREAGVRVPGSRALVLGAGGAARAVARSLRMAGADVRVSNRTPSRVAALGFPAVAWSEAAKHLAEVDVLVNATSVGMRGEEPPVPIDALPAGAAVLDCVYAPGGTKLTNAARARGLVSVPGEAMLLHQGARAFTLWTGKPAPIALMRQALEGPA